MVAAAETQGSPAYPWGLIASGAPDVWALGHTGEGIVVASQDTGVEWTHPALQPRYRGWNDETNQASHAYNWFDPFGLDLYGPCGPERGDAQVPCDDHGHGTHTVGTLLGDATAQGQTVLGMAPEATWVGCRNMLGGVGTPSSYTACFEFFLAPYPQGGDPMTDGRPDLAPDIINNSWGCPPSEGCDDPNILRQVVETARAAGQFVVASAGNRGPECSTVVDPIALYDASFSIGAYQEGGAIAYFSSRGPVTIDGSGRLKPDLSAPGMGVYSTGPGNGYFSNSGTSMAAPHVAGAVALLWSAVSTLKGDVARSEQILTMSAVPTEGDNCTTAAAPAVPNGSHGHGRLNALAAVEMALDPPTVRVHLTGTVGAGMAAWVRVRVVEPWSPAPRLVTPDANGAVVLPVYTTAWSGDRPEPVLLDPNGTRSSRLVDGYGRLLLQIDLLTPAAILPIVRNDRPR
jgi:subtilisin family serine protease